MKKNVNLCIDLKTIMQEDALLKQGQCYHGVLSRTGEDQYLFEEETHKHVDRHIRRNPKLFDGRYVSLVHMCTIHAGEVRDHRDLAFQVYSELLTALEIID